MKQALYYAKAWWKWESSVSSLYPHPDTFSAKQTLAISIIENHYFVHNSWLTPNQLLNNLSKLRNIPITIVHGRYDMVCPITQAFACKNKLPHISLIVIQNAGHSSKEPGIKKALRKWTDIMYHKTYHKTRKHYKK